MRISQNPSFQEIKQNCIDYNPNSICAAKACASEYQFSRKFYQLLTEIGAPVSMFKHKSHGGKFDPKIVVLMNAPKCCIRVSFTFVRDKVKTMCACTRQTTVCQFVCETKVDKNNSVWDNSKIRCARLFFRVQVCLVHVFFVQYNSGICYTVSKSHAKTSIKTG